MSKKSVLISGHFGEFIQGIIGKNGPVGLITLPCPVLHAKITNGISAASRPFTSAQLARFGEILGIRLPLNYMHELTMPVGAGAGSSTAFLIALARYAGFQGQPETLAAACITIEGASDPLMFPNADRLLWLSRHGTVSRSFEPPPSCDIIGGFWGPGERTNAEDKNFANIEDLVNEWACAMEVQNLNHAAQIATESCIRCNKLRGNTAPLDELARDLGALGFIRAHTGSARGFIFARGQVPDRAIDTLAEAGFKNPFAFHTSR